MEVDRSDKRVRIAAVPSMRVDAAFDSLERLRVSWVALEALMQLLDPLKGESLVHDRMSSTVAHSVTLPQPLGRGAWVMDRAAIRACLIR
jgi:hypothetical protein